jgi:hypothetical protein
MVIIADSGLGVAAFRRSLQRLADGTLEASAQAAYGKLCRRALALVD